LAISKKNEFDAGHNPTSLQIALKHNNTLDLENTKPIEPLLSIKTFYLRVFLVTPKSNKNKK
jgi:hypothetical protein